MPEPIEPIHLLMAGGGLLTGLLLGWLIATLFSQRRRHELERAVDRLETQITVQDELARERAEAWSVASQRLSASFAALASESLRTNNEAFLQLAQEHLAVHHERAKGELAAREQAVDSLVRPIRDALQRTETQIQSLEKSRQEAYGSIHHQLESMGQQNKMLQAETRKLVTALRRPEVRGQWGEVTLRRLVELAGMVNHCDFTEQDHVATEDGAIRPDLIVHLPENRTLVVDVKTPLAAYLEAVEASDDLKRKAALKRHASIFLSRIRELSAKAYWSQFDNSPDFVILFVPGDQFLSAALDEHPQLIDEALRQKVILATPSSLVALLKAVGYGWRQISLAENADQIKTLAEELYERLATFSGHLHRIGKQLGLSVEAYNKAIGSLERKVLPGARKFTELGVQPKKPIETLEAIDQTPRSGREEEDPADSQPPVAGDVDR